MTLYALWGKTRQGDDAGDPTHALVCHLLDVAAVTESLWDGALARAARERLSELLGLSAEDARRTTSFLAALHDLGKACPAFQMQYAAARPALEAAGLSLPMQGAPCYHGTVSAYALQELLRDHVGLDRRAALALSRGLGGHHGSWPTSLELQGLASWQLGGEDWRAARLTLLQALRDTLTPPASIGWPTGNNAANALTVFLAGLTSVADWIGSMNRFFPYCARPESLDGYARRARRQAERALAQVHWERVSLPAEAVDFPRLFPGYHPNPVQQGAMTVAAQLRGPSLVIIEAPTGTGKTEAALYLAEHLAAGQGQPGLYVAMPTMATSNQMHARLGEFVSHRHPGAGGPLLVHSQALWQKPPPELNLEDAPDARGWFLPRKRSLLAPFGVGTVDQTFLGVMQTRHFFVRLFGLAHKTVIFDEVHAYDTYMTTLFVRLLGWLRAMGSSVVLLSATLPASTRRQLLAAYGEEGSAMDAPYPAIHWRGAGPGGSLPLTGCPERAIGLEWVERDEPAIASRLAERLREGGTAAVICNTVGRAQSLYCTLAGAGLVDGEDLLLFHARYPYDWREAIERRVLARFGKGRPPGQRAIVVATQVIEQSLDLDFDYLISDLAPVDLLIQRAGRLHRHPRGDAERPPPLRRALLALAAPSEVNGQPQWGADGLVYEPYILLRTLLALRGRREIRTPADTGALIASVYEEAAGGDPEGWAALLEEAHQALLRRRRTEVHEASKRLLPAADDGALVRTRNEMLREEEHQVHESLQALTRLSLPSVSLVCLHREGERVLAEPQGPEICLDAAPDDAQTRLLARRTVSVTHRGAVAALRDAACPAAWQRHPLLRHCRAVLFTDGVARIGPYVLHLSREVGLEIQREVP